MTREEAIKLLVNATYSDEWQGNEDLTTAHNMAIKALEQEPILDKIRAEIEAREMVAEHTIEYQFYNMALNDVLQIIDKYKEGVSNAD